MAVGGRGLGRGRRTFVARRRLLGCLEERGRLALDAMDVLKWRADSFERKQINCNSK